MKAMKRVLRNSLIVGWLIPAATAFGQDETAGGSQGDNFYPSHNVLIVGYGSTGYSVILSDEKNPNDFAASLNPLLLFQISDQFLFEAELEFELEERVTETGLEYAQIDYSLSDNLIVAAGKFLLPFGAFSERHHPTWVNKLISPPPIYGHHGSGQPVDPLLPVLSDIGIQLRASYDVGEGGFVTAAGYVTQGPSIEMKEEAMGEDEEDHGDVDEEHGQEFPEVVFGQNFEDINEGKMFGGRFGFGVAPYFEANVSALRGDYDTAGELAFTAVGAHVEGRYGGLEIHSEWVRTKEQVAGPGDNGRVEELARNGYYVQLAHRRSNWEPIIRWGEAFDGNLGDVTVIEAGRQLALGLAYWFQPSLVGKIEYLVNREDGPHIDNDRLGFQWAFGF